jgi:hypothetical protein
MRKSLFTLAILCFLIFNAEAKYTQTCSVRYMTQDGWSNKYSVDVTFVSGSELNKATSSFKYSSFSVYAVIFWREDQVSVIKLSTFLHCGIEVDKDCITTTIGDLRGKDQDNDKWRISVSDYSFGIF